MAALMVDEFSLEVAPGRRRYSEDTPASSVRL
jgi:hypothetical protein